MEEVKGRLQDNTAIITLTGRIDSSNAAQVEEEIFKLLSDGEVGSLCIDMQGLKFISSSGLRILLKLRKILKPKCPKLLMNRLLIIKKYAKLLMKNYLKLLYIH